MYFDKKAVLNMLDELNIVYEHKEHSAAFTLDEMMELRLPYEENIAKNLFIRNDKKQNYYLLTIAGGKKADLKNVRNFLGERPLKFASEEDLDKIMGLKKGSVTPFGILNDSESKVKVLMDRAYRGKIIGVHPNDNTATVWLKTEDLMNIIISRGNEAEYIEI